MLQKRITRQFGLAFIMLIVLACADTRSAQAYFVSTAQALDVFTTGIWTQGELKAQVVIDYPDYQYSVKESIINPNFANNFDTWEVLGDLHLIELDQPSEFVQRYVDFSNLAEASLSQNLLLSDDQPRWVAILYQLDSDWLEPPEIPFVKIDFEDRTIATISQPVATWSWKVVALPQESKGKLSISMSLRDDLGVESNLRIAAVTTNLILAPHLSDFLLSAPLNYEAVNFSFINENGERVEVVSSLPLELQLSTAISTPNLFYFKAYSRENEQESISLSLPVLIDAGPPINISPPIFVTSRDREYSTLLTMPNENSGVSSIELRSLDEPSIKIDWNPNSPFLDFADNWSFSSGQITVGSFATEMNSHWLQWRSADLFQQWSEYSQYFWHD